MFAAMMDAIKEESVGYVFNLEVQVEEEQAAEGEHHAEVVAKGSTPRAVRRACSTPRRPSTATRRPSPLRRRSSRAPTTPTATCRATAVPVQLGEEVQALPRRPAQQVSRRR